MVKKSSDKPVLIVGKSTTNANLYYATGFLAPDSFAYVSARDKTYVMVSSMEKGRAEKESKVDTVISDEEYGYMNKVRATGDQRGAYADVLAQLLKDVSARNVTVQGEFPLELAENLRARGINIEVAELTIEGQRQIKTRGEIALIQRAQQVNEKGMARAESLFRSSTIKNGILHHRGRPLTAEQVQREIEIVFVKNGYETTDSIVAAGPGAADPHFIGAGPIPAHQMIVVDIFPFGKKDRYFADMTRTFVKGKPTKRMREMYNLVLEAQEAALRSIKEGVTGKFIDDQVCDVFEKDGYGTPRTKSKAGYLHSTGHGVGLEIHEAPRLSQVGTNPLKAGMVVTVEPGLYDPKVGGVRIEDIVVVTKTGCKNLTRYPKELII
ncbi:MAG TPA: Xaa-Pro peptidase family protein [Methanocella sp.]|nr:Xaa-Pro peptidase family protein [Methanocella sp.]